MNRKKVGLMAGIGLLMAAAAVPGTALADTGICDGGQFKLPGGKIHRQRSSGNGTQGDEDPAGIGRRNLEPGDSQRKRVLCGQPVSEQPGAGPVSWMGSQPHRSMKKMYMWKARRTCSWTKTGNLLHFPR